MFEAVRLFFLACLPVDCFLLPVQKWETCNWILWFKKKKLGGITTQYSIYNMYAIYKYFHI